MKNDNLITKSVTSWCVLRFFAFTILLSYLCVEVVFNSYLLDVAMNIESSADDFNQAELIGRTVSSFGVCLFSFRLLLALFKTRLSVLVALCVLWCVSFFGQKIIIESIVGASSANERQVTLQYATLVKASQFSSGFRHYGSKSDVINVILPSLMYLKLVNSDVLEGAVRDLRQHKQVVVQELNTRSLGGLLYDSFLVASQRMNGAYGLYRLVEGYRNGETNKDASVAWSEIKKEYEKMVLAKDEFKKGGEGLLNRHGVWLADLMREANLKLSGCDDNWLRRQYIRRVGEHPVLVRSDFCDWFPDDVKKPPKYRDDKEYYRDLYGRVILKHHIKHEKIDFYPTFEKTVATKSFQSKIVEKFDVGCFGKPVSSEVDLAKALFECKLLRGRKSKDLHKMLELREGLNFSEFVKMNESDGFKPELNGEVLNVELYKKSDIHHFNKNVLPLMLKKPNQEWASALFTEEDEFDRGGRFFEKGKDSYRSLIAIPLALMLSLFFSAISLIRLVSLSISCFLSSKASEFISVAALVIVIFHPLVSDTGRVTSSYLLNVSGIGSSTLLWVARMEPVVYHIGKDMRDKWYFF